MKKGNDSKENDFMDEIVLTFSNKKSFVVLFKKIVSPSESLT